MKILKEILLELKEIKKALQTIASSLECEKTLVQENDTVNYFNDDPEAIAFIKNKDVSKIIQELIGTQVKVSKLESRINSDLK